MRYPKFRRFFIGMLLLALVPAIASAKINPQDKPKDLIEDFLERTSDIQEAMAESREEASAEVIEKLGDAIAILEIAKVGSFNRDRRRFKAAIKQLSLYQRRSEFLSPRKERGINEELKASAVLLIGTYLERGQISSSQAADFLEELASN